MTTVQVDTTGFSGNQLRTLRIAQGLSLDTLASLISVSRQYVHQLETGARTPNADNIQNLATTLGVDELFFSKQPKNEIAPEHVNFRAARTTAISVKRQVIAYTSLFERLVSFLSEYLDFPPVDIPEMSVIQFSSEEIEQCAEHMRGYWRLGIDTPVSNMMRVLENCGCILSFTSAFPAKFDAISLNRPRPIVIGTTADLNTPRLRFSLAHELGHLVMHNGIETGDHETEAQANRFASAFLLPRKAMISEFPRGERLNWQALYSLKQRWKVSVRAILRRAYDLELIDSDLYKRGNIYLSKTGQTKSENFDNLVQAEQPVLINKALQLVYDEYGMTIPEIARNIYISPKLLKVMLPDAPSLPERPNNVVLLRQTTQS
jgi:Zn-dependent peptidase ImmA (M78 family)/DNA-binding XRE family transcriptional regulator